MKASYTTLLAGVLALVFCGTAIAHDSGYHQPPATGQLSGTVVLWSGGQGYTGWSGSLSYGLPPGYQPGYIAWAPHRHLRACRHPSHFAPPRYGQERAYRNGHRDRHHNSHGRGHLRHH